MVAKRQLAWKTIAVHNVSCEFDSKGGCKKLGCSCDCHKPYTWNVRQIVETIADKELYTKELYRALGSYLRPHLKEAESYGLIQRMWIKQEGMRPRLLTKLTDKGRELLLMLKQNAKPKGG